MFGVGVPRVDAGGDFDLWLPAYMLFAFLLIRFVAHMRLSIATSVAAFVGGTLWAWSSDALGILPAGAVAVLLAFAAGEIVRRRGRPQTRRG